VILARAAFLAAIAVSAIAPVNAFAIASRLEEMALRKSPGLNRNCAISPSMSLPAQSRFGVIGAKGRDVSASAFRRASRASPTEPRT
jgi:hypothetical protein